MICFDMETIFSIRLRLSSRMHRRETSYHLILMIYISLNVMTMHWKTNNNRQTLKMMASLLTTPPLLRSIRLHTTLNPIMLLIMLILLLMEISKIEKTASLEKPRLRKKNPTNQTKLIILWQELLIFIWKTSNWVVHTTTYQVHHLIRWLDLLIFSLQHSPLECSCKCP